MPFSTPHCIWTISICQTTFTVPFAAMNNKGGHLHMSWCCNWERMDDQWHWAMNSSLVLPQRTIVCLSDSQEKKTHQHYCWHHGMGTHRIWLQLTSGSGMDGGIWLHSNVSVKSRVWMSNASSNTTLLQSFNKKTPGHMQHMKLLCHVKVLLWSATSPDLFSVTHTVQLRRQCWPSAIVLDFKNQFQQLWADYRRTPASWLFHAGFLHVWGGATPCWHGARSVAVLPSPLVNGFDVITAMQSNNLSTSAV